MPVLNWIGKDAVVNHDKDVPFKLLQPVEKLSVGKDSENLIIEGDNLEALKALMPFYQNKVKCIYIDPPYNTGNEKWVYNDNVNSPKIKKWLGKVVGGEAQDLCRHDKWLCMMYPRLKLLRDLLRDDGIIFISLDRNELENLIILMNDLFGKTNHVETIIWRKKEGGGQQDAFLVTEHEYILAYAKDKTRFSFVERKASARKDGYNLIDEKSDRKYKLVKLAKWGSGALREDRPTMHFSILDPDNNENFPVAPDGRPGRWRYGKTKVKELLGLERIEFQRKQNRWMAYEKVYEPADGDSQVLKQRSIFYDIATTRDGTNELKLIFGEKDTFQHPKPSDLITELILMSSEDNSIILDSFAGSGTTGHATLKANKLDGKERKFVLVELEKDIAEKLTSERIRRVIKGDLNESHEAGFQYCKLDKPLFDKEGQIDESCSFEQLARYIYFTETNTPLNGKEIKRNLVGTKDGTDYYLIYNGKNKNVLNLDFIKKLKGDNRKVVYADRCLLDDDTLQENSVEFKQIPYEVKVY